MTQGSLRNLPSSASAGKLNRFFYYVVCRNYGIVPALKTIVAHHRQQEMKIPTYPQLKAFPVQAIGVITLTILLIFSVSCLASST